MHGKNQIRRDHCTCAPSSQSFVRPAPREKSELEPQQPASSWQTCVWICASAPFVHCVAQQQPATTALILIAPEPSAAAAHARPSVPNPTSQSPAQRPIEAAPVRSQSACRTACCRSTAPTPVSNPSWPGCDQSHVAIPARSPRDLANHLARPAARLPGTHRCPGQQRSGMLRTHPGRSNIESCDPGVGVWETSGLCLPIHLGETRDTHAVERAGGRESRSQPACPWFPRVPAVSPPRNGPMQRFFLWPMLAHICAAAEEWVYPLPKTIIIPWASVSIRQGQRMLTSSAAAAGVMRRLCGHAIWVVQVTHFVPSWRPVWALPVFKRRRGSRPQPSCLSEPIVKSRPDQHHKDSNAPCHAHLKHQREAESPLSTRNNTEKRLPTSPTLMS